MDLHSPEEFMRRLSAGNAQDIHSACSQKQATFQRRKEEDHRENYLNFVLIPEYRKFTAACVHRQAEKLQDEALWRPCKNGG